MKFLKSRKNILIGLLFFIVLILQLNSKFAYVNFGPDNLMQTITARSLLESNGMSVPEANLNDLAKPVYRHYGCFPPGLALILMPFLKISDFNIISSIRIINVISVILLLSCLLWILTALRDIIDSKAIFFILGFWMFAPNPFKAGGATDIISLFFILLAFFLFIKCLMDNNKNNSSTRLLGYAFFIGFASFLASFFRLAYYPISFAIPSVFLLYSITFKKQMLKYSLLSMGIVFICMAGLIWFQNNYFGEVNFVVNSTGRNFFPEHLKIFDAVFYNSLSSDSFLYRTFSEDSLMKHASSELFIPLFSGSIIVFIMFVSGLYFFYKSVKNKFENKFLLINSESFWIILAASFVIVFNIGFLTVLSLIYPSFSMDPSYLSIWISMPRYFMPSFICIQLIVFVLLFNKEIIMPKWWRNSGYFILVLSFITNFGFWFYNERKLQVFDPVKTGECIWTDSQELKRLVDESSNTVLIKTFDDQLLYRYAITQNGSWCEFSDVKNKKLCSSEETRLLLIVKDTANIETEQFIKKNKAEKIKFLPCTGAYVYKIDLRPTL